MIVTPLKLTDVMDFDWAKSSGGTRSEGLHVSDIYNAWFAEREPERYARIGEGVAEDPTVRFELGFAVEAMVEWGIRRRHGARPHEQQTEEGIWFSPDVFLLEHEGDRLRVGEIKVTWMSSKEVPREQGVNSFPPKFDKYLVQLKAACYNLGTPYARLYVFFVNGRYDCRNRAEDLTPELLVWNLTFTTMELQENWDQLMSFAKARKMLERIRK